MYSRNPTFHSRIIAWRRTDERGCWEADCRFESKPAAGVTAPAYASTADAAAPVEAPAGAEAEETPPTTMWYRLEAHAGSPTGQVIAEIDHR